MCSLWRDPWSLKGWEPLNEAWSRPFLRIPSGIEIYSLLGVTMEKALAPHSSTLAWKIPWMEEPGRLQSMGSVRVGRDRATSLSLFTFLHWRKHSCLENPRDSGVWWAAVYGVAQSRTRLKWLSSSSSRSNQVNNSLLDVSYSSCFILLRPLILEPRDYFFKMNDLHTKLLFESSLLGGKTQVTLKHILAVSCPKKRTINHRTLQVSR